MKYKNFQVKNLDVKIYSFLNENLNEKKQLIKEILSEISEDKEIGFAGWKSKEGLRENLDFNLEDKRIPKLNINFEKIVNKIKNLLEKTHLYLNKRLWVYLFPTNSTFVKEELNGVTGFCPWKNLIYIYVHPECNLNDLEKVIIHELAHSVSKYYKSLDMSIGEGLIFEGLAENFVEAIEGEEDKNLSQVITEKKAKEIFFEIKKILKEKDFKHYSEVFYGTGKYPNWTGYSIGYYLIEQYIKQKFKDKKEINWRELLRNNPNKILSEINF